LQEDQGPDVEARVGRFFRESRRESVQIWMTGLDGNSVGLTPEEGRKILDAIRDDTHLSHGERPGTQAAGFVACIQIHVDGELESLLVFMDPWGFSIGQYPGNRIVNPALAARLEELLRSRGWAERDYWDYALHLLKKGAGKIGPEEEAPDLLKDRGDSKNRPTPKPVPEPRRAEPDTRPHP
jgi:hypothetical protein